MIALVTGTVRDKTKDSVVLMTAAGVGFELLVSIRTLAELPEEGREATLYSYLAVREDAVNLYGFLTREEKELFLSLITVSGVGAKMALAALSAMSVTELKMALIAGDTRALARIPGVGKKTAERIALELRGKVEEPDFRPSGSSASDAASADANLREAVQALMALGFNSVEATRALAGTQADTVEAMIVEALQRLGGR